MNWISIHDSSPKMFCYKREVDGTKELCVISEKVLATDGDGVEVASIEDGMWQTGHETICGRDITHWMPFPKPPSKDEVEKVRKKLVCE